MQKRGNQKTDSLLNFLFTNTSYFVRLTERTGADLEADREEERDTLDDLEEDLDLDTVPLEERVERVDRETVAFCSFLELLSSSFTSELSLSLALDFTSVSSCSGIFTQRLSSKLFN